eukprot:TRINITY_DN1516_c0_g1_i2.p1 TRINITY_DN1516_c0_g1~~TRINITY_DN1516_c0_g1_i2.p1  ORF type:complete len:391 (+),score=60.45 TRINITY_DN1516_c0_g1_i2:73-1173(+)
MGPLGAIREGATGVGVSPALGDTPRGTQPRVTRGAKKEYTPLSWKDYYDEAQDIELPDTHDRFRIYLAGTSGPVFVLLHGGGHSALSWAVCVSMMKETCRVLAIDLRGHGETHTEDESNLSVPRVVDDVVGVLDAHFEKEESQSRPPIVLVGHSMGGAMAVHVAGSGRVKGLAGLIVIDVVEGTALASLPHMLGILHERPASFPSVEKAIEWGVRSRTVRNLESARLSLPSQVVGQGGKYVWRTDLFATEPYWRSWFEGISERFLSVREPKLLMLAGTDRLDKALTIGQMQGKFQLLILPEVGHIIQEDAPTRVSQALIGFMRRNMLDLPPGSVPPHFPASMQSTQQQQFLSLPSSPTTFTTKQGL